MDQDDIDDLAFGIVSDYLRDGPEFIAISETVFDETDGEATDEDVEKVHEVVTRTLKKLKSDFNIA